MSINNIAETVLKQKERESNDSSKRVCETRLKPQNEDISVLQNRISKGEKIGGKYNVICQIDNNGTQATIFKVECEGEIKIAKVYKNGYEPSSDFLEYLKGHKCNFVINLLDYGFYEKKYYEIYDYYEAGTLEDKGKCSFAYIRDVVVPNLNEGLHFLHTLGNKGIIHGDMKPSNIFVSNDGMHVILGDFGISYFCDENGTLIDDIKGTPEYAPRTISFFEKIIKTTAYDYGAFGLILIKLATGHSLFEGLDTISIAQMWEEGLEIPSNIDGRLKRLIKGLILDDEKKRFGYEEVKKWCEGEFIQIKEDRNRDKNVLNNKEMDPFLFGIFDNRIVTVSSLDELSEAIIENWDHCKKLFKKIPFYDFIGQFDVNMAEDIKKYSKLQDEDAVVFFTLYRIKNISNLIYKGKDYGNLNDFIAILKTDKTPDIYELIFNELFEYYLKINGYDEKLIFEVNNIVNLQNSNKDVIPKILYYLFQSEKKVELNGKIVRDINEFIKEIVKMKPIEIEQLLADDNLIGWLYSIGYKEDIIKLCKM